MRGRRPFSETNASTIIISSYIQPTFWIGDFTTELLRRFDQVSSRYCASSDLVWIGDFTIEFLFRIDLVTILSFTEILNYSENTVGISLKSISGVILKLNNNNLVLLRRLDVIYLSFYQNNTRRGRCLRIIQLLEKLIIVIVISVAGHPLQDIGLQYTPTVA